MASSDALPSRGFRLSRDHTVAAAYYDPCAGIEFCPAVGSDELFEALKLAFPRGKNNKARMREAIIEFLISEREAERSRSQSPEIARDNQDDIRQDTDRVAARSGKLSTISSSPTSYAENTETEVMPKIVGNPATEIGNAKPHPDSVSKTTFDELTIVWNSVDGMAQKPRIKRSMTEKELERYRLRRALGACRVCKAKKRKSSTDDEEHPVPQLMTDSDTSNNTLHSTEDDSHFQNGTSNRLPSSDSPESVTLIRGDKSSLRRDNHSNSGGNSNDNQHLDKAVYHFYRQPESDDFDETLALTQQGKDVEQLPLQDIAPLDFTDTFLSEYSNSLSTFDVYDFPDSLSWTYEETSTPLSWPSEDTNMPVQSAPMGVSRLNPLIVDFAPATVVQQTSLDKLCGESEESLSRSSSPIKSMAAPPPPRPASKRSAGRQAASEEYQQQLQPLKQPAVEVPVQRSRHPVSTGFSTSWLGKFKTAGQKLTKSSKSRKDETVSKPDAIVSTMPGARSSSPHASLKTPAGEASTYCQICLNKVAPAPSSSQSYPVLTYCPYCGSVLDLTGSSSHHWPASNGSPPLPPGSICCATHGPPHQYMVAADSPSKTSYADDTLGLSLCLPPPYQGPHMELAAEPSTAAHTSPSPGSLTSSRKQTEPALFPAYELELSSALGGTRVSGF